MDNDITVKGISSYMSLPEVENAAMQNIIVNVAEAIRPLFEALRSMAETMKPVYEFNQSLRAIGLLAQNQFVYWEYIDLDFCNKLLNAKNINKCIMEKCSENNFRFVKATIRKCRNNELMKPYRTLFSQAIMAYEEKHYAISTLGLLAIADGMLTDISGDPTHKAAPRVEKITGKVIKNEDLVPDEYAILCLGFTFKKTMDTFTCFKSFNDIEPDFINRHWLMHGRSRKKVTQLDCIKLLNYLYGIMLLGGFSKLEKD